MKKYLLVVLSALSLGFAYAQPPGTVTAFAGPKIKIPVGWVVCDGTLYDRTATKYVALFNAIGVSWGGDGGNKFAVPDLRGQFLRGVSDNSNNDPDKDSRNKSRPDLNSSGNGENAVGSKQLGEVGNHIHPITDPGHTHFSRTGKGFANGGMQVYARNDAGFDVQTETTSSPTNITIVGNGGKETRPVNAYVYYIIKL